VAEDEDGAPAEEGVPAWMATFGDLMSLLLCFFVLLLSFANMDVVKWAAMVGSMKDAFGSQQLEPGHLDSKSSSVFELTQSDAASRPVVAMPTHRASKADPDLLRKIEMAAKGRNLERWVEIEETDRGVTARVLGELLFEPGSAKLRAESLLLLEELASLVSDVDEEVSVEGHSDSQNAGAGESNWGISTARAVATVRYLVEVAGINPERLAAAGYAEYRPIAPNDTSENRERNRRVEFVFLHKNLRGDRRP
jgi:chemotaxis protein MotB